MVLTRVIPILLIKGNDGLYKGQKFADHKYVGDPMNAIRIFNEKEVDELMLIDITATNENRVISKDLIYRVSSECFMPLTVGGGFRRISDVEIAIQAGAEKISINTFVFENLNFVTEVANKFGSQSVVVSVDVKKNWLGRYEIFSNCGQKKEKVGLIEFLRSCESAGAGEILLNSISDEGLGQGYNIGLISEVCSAVSIPVIVNGGAGSVDHFAEAVKVGGASAVAAGSFFVFHGKRRAVLISYPSKNELEKVLN